MATGTLMVDQHSCPDLESIAAFLDGRLAAHERESMMGHLAGCERCYFIVAESAQTRRASTSASAGEPWWQRRRVIWSGAAALATAATLLIALLPTTRENSAHLQQLVVAVGTERVIGPRLSGGFAYGPRRTVRSAEPSALSLSPDLRMAAASVEKETASRQSAPALHARGTACLLTGNLPCAITSLQQAADERPEDARILNDLAAGYLVSAERARAPADLSRALATLNRALEIDRLLPEARFNRATALEGLGMHAEAREAWQAYLTLDDRSGWADEARTRLHALTPTP